MYPNLFYFFKDVFNIEIKGLMLLNTFGFFVALAFVAGATVLTKELKRKERLGYFSYTEKIIDPAKPTALSDVLINAVLGFLLGYKILGAFFIEGALDNPPIFIFSSEGHLLSGLFLAGIFAYFKWSEGRKNAKKKDVSPQKIRIWPSDKVGDVVLIAAIAGFLGAKIFDNLEHWDSFVQDPIGSLFSASGLTFYGGLIVAIIVLFFYFKKRGISFIRYADAAAPALMLSYAVGRMGCHFSGDGDWGIINSAYVSSPDGAVLKATPEQFEMAANMYKNVTEQFGIVGEMQHVAFSAPSWLPDWVVAYTYPHNVNKEGIPLENCGWADFCNYLPLPVFPTPLYEIIVCLLFFALLWTLRKHLVTPGTMFAIYLILNGVERFFIEKIRVNTKYDLPLNPSQAELISVGLILAGVLLFVYAKKRWTPPAISN